MSHEGRRPEHPSGVPSTASDETPGAPDEPVGRFETGNDPSGGARWIRRRFRLSSPQGGDEAMAALLELPGVARAALDPDGREIVADVEPATVADDELTAAIGRGGVEVAGWDDEPIPDRERSTEQPDPPSDGDSDIVDEESEESFPASDAPSSWARPADGEQP